MWLHLKMPEPTSTQNCAKVYIEESNFAVEIIQGIGQRRWTKVKGFKLSILLMAIDRGTKVIFSFTFFSSNTFGINSDRLYENKSYRSSFYDLALLSSKHPWFYSFYFSLMAQVRCSIFLPWVWVWLWDLKKSSFFDLFISKNLTI